MQNIRRIISASVVILAITSPHHCFAGDGGLKFSVAVDMVGEYNASGQRASDKFQPRIVDLMAYGAIDPYFDGLMSLAAHNENGQSIFELHEAYISSDRLIPMTNFRAGQFFLNIGRLSRFHQHEWAFTSTPLVHQSFFGNEGVLDSGVELSILIPSSSFFELTLGATNGFTFGHSHDAGSKPKQPTHYAHLLSFFSLGSLDVQPGISALTRHASDGRKSDFLGIEMTGKVNTQGFVRWLTQSEAWYRRVKPKSGEEEVNVGLYSYLQYGFSSRFNTGVRFDYLTNTTLKDVEGKKVENWQRAIVPSVAYKPSEFSLFRLSYNHRNVMTPLGQEENTSTIEIQTTFVLGAHPTHAF